MSLERLPVILHITRFRDIDFAAEKILGSPAALSALDTHDAIAQTAIREYPEVRAVGLIPLLHKQTEHLPLEERLGLLCFTTLVVEADRVIDTYDLRGRNRQELERGILDSPMLHGGFTIRQLRDATLAYFPIEKATIISSFLESMLDYHTDHGLAPVGSYGFDEALSYRQKTNFAWVDTTFTLADIDDPKSKEWIHAAGMIAQLRDDLRDWPVDWQQNSYNLFLGLAKDYRPEELQLLNALVSRLAPLNEPERKKASRAAAKQYAPKSRVQYGHMYHKFLSQVPDFATRFVLAIKGVD